MEKTLERSEDKIQKICDQLKRETLEPARQEAQQILGKAEQRAHEIIEEAENRAERLLAEAKDEIERERRVFHSSLEQAGKQGLASLKQQIEHKLFTDALSRLVEKGSQDAGMIARLVEAIVHAIEKQGIETDLTAEVPKNVSAEQVNSQLAQEVFKRLGQGVVSIGDFAGGAKVKLVDKTITLDISDQAIKELLASYVRKDFRELLFGK